ncbi:MAG: hypothetical protein KGD64_11620 [Candidatus Heimdallarchaeota archaeon]|nr:hypothetical protein [Candidatus Heimdallarchaeota archaeon]
METEKLSPIKDLNSIKLIKGQRDSYGWEIKLIGESEKEILERLKLVNDELVKTYTELNQNGGK